MRRSLEVSSAMKEPADVEGRSSGYASNIKLVGSRSLLLGDLLPLLPRLGQADRDRLFAAFGLSGLTAPQFSLLLFMKRAVHFPLCLRSILRHDITPSAGLSVGR
jgi:hypothetical protein